VVKIIGAIFGLLQIFALLLIGFMAGMFLGDRIIEFFASWLQQSLTG